MGILLRRPSQCLGQVYLVPEKRFLRSPWTFIPVCEKGNTKGTSVTELFKVFWFLAVWIILPVVEFFELKFYVNDGRVLLVDVRKNDWWEIVDTLN